MSNSDFPLPATPLCAVAFDLDGLMFNTEDIYLDVGTEVLRRRGKDFTPELRHEMMGRQAAVALQIMIDYHRLDATVEVISQESEEIFATLLVNRLAPMPGLLPLLDALEAAEMPKCVATSSAAPFAHRVLKMTDLHDRFAFVLTAEDIERGKPEPEIYETAASKLGVAPSQLMVLEDSGIGCRAGVSSGAYAIAVPSDHSHHHQFDGAKFVANSLADTRIYQSLGLSPIPATKSSH